MSRASNDILDAIHGMLAGALKDELERAMSARDEDGNRVPINPQLLDKVMKFLKDNDVTAPASNKPLNDLAQQLSALDVDVDDEAISLRH
jgi:hypothetical protein